MTFEDITKAALDSENCGQSASSVDFRQAPLHFFNVAAAVRRNWFIRTHRALWVEGHALLSDSHLIRPNS